MKPKMLDDAILVKLLELLACHTKKLRALESAAGSDIPNMTIDGLLDIVLDALGVPADNTAETNACEIANLAGEWPDDAVSRDWLFQEWYDIENGESKTTISGFPAWVRSELAVVALNEAATRVAVADEQPLST